MEIGETGKKKPYLRKFLSETESSDWVSNNTSQGIRAIEEGSRSCSHSAWPVKKEYWIFVVWRSLFLICLVCYKEGKAE